MTAKMKMMIQRTNVRFPRAPMVFPIMEMRRLSVGQDLANLNTLSWGGGDDGDGGGGGSGGLDGDGQLEQSQLGRRRHGGGGGEDLHCDNCFEVDTELEGLGELKQQAS